VKNYSISQVAYVWGYDCDVVPRAGMEDYYDAPTTTVGFKKLA
jgi:hypothetical protein